MGSADVEPNNADTVYTLTPFTCWRRPAVATREILPLPANVEKSLVPIIRPQYAQLFFQIKPGGS